MHPIEHFTGPTEVFLKKIFNSLGEDMIDVSDYEADHICYRVETIERYDEIGKLISPYADLLAINEIGGRPISVYRLHEPIVYKDKKIYGFELPSPKTGSSYKEGYEHIEIVIDTTFFEFMEKYSYIQFDTRAMGKEINPEIARNYTGYSVKFHHHTLEYIVTTYK